MIVEPNHDPVLEAPLERRLVLDEYNLSFFKRPAGLTATTLLTLIFWLGISRAVAWNFPGRSAITHALASDITTIIGLGWALATWLLFFVWSAHVRTLGWNAIELQLAANLREYGRYALGPMYPTVLWRPALGPILLSPLDWLSPDPLLSFRMLTATALAIFTFSMHYCGCRLGGGILGSIAAAMTLPLPAITYLLLNHQHTLSHIVMLAVLGPAVAVSLAIVDVGMNSRAASIPLLVASGLLWGLSVLARPELLLAAAVFLAAYASTTWTRRPWRLIAVPVGAFLLIFLPHQAWVSHEAAKYDLLSDKKLYQFYASQGWSVLKPGSGSRDIEAEGYEYAIELYGTPESNDFSVARAIWRNPRAFAARLEENSTRLQAVLRSEHFFSPLLRLLMVGAPLIWGLVLVSGGKAQTRTFLWAAASFATVAVFLALHIDERYVTVSVPFAILLALYSVHGLAALAGNRRQRIVLTVAFVVAAALIPGGVRRVFSMMPKECANLEPMRELARQFIAITRPTKSDRAQMYVAFGLDVRRPAEDVFMFWYFTRTTMAMGRPSDSTYPRNRLYSFRACAPTHGIVRPGAPRLPGARSLGDSMSPSSATIRWCSGRTRRCVNLEGST